LLLLACLNPLAGQGDPADLSVAVREWRQANEQGIVDGFVELLSLPNVASDSRNIRRNADLITQLLTARGFQAQLLETAGSPPAVFGERNASGADRTLMIYAHYDGQPVNAVDWASEPWTPVMRDGPVELDGREVPMTAPFDPEWRIFARSAGDDKAPVIALLAALDALDSLGLAPTVNLKVFFEGEEEAGSPHLGAMLKKHRELLGADLWLFCDGPMHPSRRWQLVYGVRGSYGFDLTVFGANRPLHSGHYGNWSPNPIARLLELVGTMRDGQGRITIENYGDQVVAPSSRELQAIETAPGVDAALVRELGIGRPETGERIEQAIMRPALNLRGIHSGDIGTRARNSIQTSATASIGLRLVPDQTPVFLRAAVERHIREQGYLVVHQDPTSEQRAGHDRIARIDWEEGGYPAYRAPLDLPLAQTVADTLNSMNGGTLVELPTMGGSLPLYLIDEVIGAPILILPIANHDNNQHGKDENLRLQNLWDAIEIYAAVLTSL
jgi:acetylornithine deacetylase/succinyl-diaminopimelate desuccinylase-like protein